MTNPDPFAAFESERTVIKPKPRTPGGAPSAPAPAPFFGGADPTPAAEVGELGLLNPLVSAAGKLLGQLYDRNCRRGFAPAAAFQADALPPDRFHSEMQVGTELGG